MAAAKRKSVSPPILSRFAELCGGGGGRIAIIPTASQLDDTGARYETVFAGMGVGRVDIVHLETRGDCEAPEQLEVLATRQASSLPAAINCGFPR